MQSAGDVTFGYSTVLMSVELCFCLGGYQPQMSLVSFVAFYNVFKECVPAYIRIFPIIITALCSQVLHFSS